MWQGHQLPPQQDGSSALSHTESKFGAGIFSRLPRGRERLSLQCESLQPVDSPAEPLEGSQLPNDLAVCRAHGSQLLSSCHL